MSAIPRAPIVTSPLAWLEAAERQRREAGLRRSLRPRPAVATELDLASNDCLGLSQHPDVIEGGVAGLRMWGAGCTANLGAVVGLSGPGSLLVSDAHSHASLVDACRLSRARVLVTPHRDVGAVDATLGC